MQAILQLFALKYIHRNKRNTLRTQHYVNIVKEIDIPCLQLDFVSFYLSVPTPACQLLSLIHI